MKEAHSCIGPINWWPMPSDLVSHNSELTLKLTTPTAAVEGVHYMRTTFRMDRNRFKYQNWKKDIESVGGAPADFPIIDDAALQVAKLYDMLPAEAYLPDGRTANDSATVRTTFIIGPDKKIRLMLIYPMTVGRNFDEILRALDAVQLSDRFPIATPANWKVGEDIIVKTSVSTDDAKKQFENVQVLLPYLRKASAPK